MTNKLSIKAFIVGFSMMLIFSAGAFAQSKTDCSKVTDKEIVKQIYDKIMAKYSSQVSHINVRAANGVVTVEGWVTSKSIKKEIEKWAKKITCVKKVVNTLGTVPTGCSEGYKQCGDTCIPEKETCNLCRGVPCF
jgi:predicted membrane chloride channel (bestrophin family)